MLYTPKNFSEYLAWKIPKNFCVYEHNKTNPNHGAGSDHRKSNLSHIRNVSQALAYEQLTVELQGSLYYTHNTTTLLRLQSSSIVITAVMIANGYNVQSQIPEIVANDEFYHLL